MSEEIRRIAEEVLREQQLWNLAPMLAKEHNLLRGTHNLRYDNLLDIPTASWLDLSNAPFVDVRKFGAVGDGIENDTGALNEAFAEGGNIFLPNGTYLVSGSGEQCLSALVSDTRIVGESMGGTIIKLADGQTVNNVLSTYESPASEKYRMQFENFTIDGNKANQTGTQTMNGLRVDDTTYACVRRVYAKNVYSNNPPTTEAGGIIAVDSWDVIFDNCFVNGIDGYGFYMGNVSMSWVRGVMNKCFATACGSVGINAWNVRNVLVQACHAYANTVSGFMFEDCYNINIAGGSAYLNGGIGVWLNETSDSIISALLSYDNNSHGIAVYGTSGYQADNNIVIGCRAGDTRGSKSQDYGIYEGAYADGNLYIGNNVKDNVNAPIYLTSSSSKCLHNITDESVDVASAATVTLPNTGGYFNITGTTNITSITASWARREVTLKFAGILTFTDGSNLKLAGNFVTTADDVITLVCDGTNWYEKSRSVN